jgi:hypothetical protein
MKISNLIVAATAVLTFTPLAAQPPGGPPAPPCDAARYICGQQGPEDLVALGSDWAVASALRGTGGVYLIRLDDHASVRAYPSASARETLDTSSYPDCPGPPSTGELTTHGVYVAPGRGPVYKLWVVGHGARESIEVFDVDTTSAIPTLTWIGCAIAPEPIGLNSVRGLPDGGFVTTNFNPRDVPMQQMRIGEPNGELWEWHAESGWSKVPGSEASGANGVELSRDGQTLYIAAWGSQSLIRMTRGWNPPEREEIDLGFRIDNIHWARDGRLIGAGQADQDWRVVTIDPETLAVETIYSQADRPGFGGGTVALEVGDALWIGSFQGDRIAIVRP